MSALETYLRKIELDGYKKRVEVENKVATGELPVSTLSLRQERGFAPYKERLKKAGALAQQLDMAGLGMWWAFVEKAIAETLKAIPNMRLATTYAKMAVKVLEDAGVKTEEAVQFTAEVVGIPKERLLGTATRGGAPAGGGATPGA